MIDIYTMEFTDEELLHYGIPRRSGRYPWGSGDNPYQHSGDFLARINDLHKRGMTDSEIVEAMGLKSTTELRTLRAIAKEEQRSLQVATAKSLHEKGMGASEIGRQMGLNESTVRSLLNASSEARMNQARETAEFLKKQVDEKGMIDIGAGVERELGISREKLNEAITILETEGYPNYGNRVPQATNPGKQTTLKVLCPPGTEHSEIYNYENIHTIKDYRSHDDGETFKPKFAYPASMDSSRLMIRYAEDGGKEKDGTIEIRRNVEDLSLGESHYAQVRILVDNDKFIKGMAWYSDDMPPGVDVIFNTNKTKDKSLAEVLKPIKTSDPNNPFGALIKEDGGQSYYIGKDGKEHLSLINKRAEEGDWGDWADKVPSQFLSKQPAPLVERQLNLAKSDKQAEFDEIMMLTNPTVKKRLLESFSESCDSAAEHLKAAALPRQKYQVILPITSMKDNEIYAPNYKDGEEVALIRYPHGGTFEIPILKVNNKQPEAVKMLGPHAADAVGINSKVAERLSGADFDGDTVMVIPNRGVNIVSTPPLDGLKGFDPKLEYGGKPEGSFKKMTNTQTEMGKISNLITDMTIMGASTDELARAVRHSMVVIDAEKHKLDYKQSEADNNIAALKREYQGRIENGRYREGAATLISRAKAEVSVDKREGSPTINKETGELEWKTARDSKLYYTTRKEKVDKKTGEVTIIEKQNKRTQKSTQMREVKDARELSTGHQIEEAYADYANTMKGLANQARLAIVNTSDIPYSQSASKVYAAEVESLKSKLNIALMNAPKERQAQIYSSSKVAAVKASNPDITRKEEKKIAQQALTEARNRLGAQRTPVDITDREWEAIQAGAIHKTTLRQILNNTDIDVLKAKATPKDTKPISNGIRAKIEAMKASGYYTNAQIAEAVGLSPSTITKVINGKV